MVHNREAHNKAIVDGIGAALDEYIQKRDDLWREHAQRCQALKQQADEDSKRIKDILSQMMACVKRLQRHGQEAQAALDDVRRWIAEYETMAESYMATRH